MATRYEEHQVNPQAAIEDLRVALASAGIVLPSLSVEYASPDLKLVELGRVRADVAAQLADVIRHGGCGAAEVDAADEGAL